MLERTSVAPEGISVLSGSSSSLHEARDNEPTASTIVRKQKNTFFIVLLFIVSPGARGNGEKIKSADTELLLVPRSEALACAHL